jgi:hypothetical protein
VRSGKGYQASQCLPIRHLKGETIIGEPHCSPEVDINLIWAQYVHRNALIFRPDLRQQDLRAMPTNAETTLVAFIVNQLMVQLTKNMSILDRSEAMQHSSGGLGDITGFWDYFLVVNHFRIPGIQIINDPAFSKAGLQQECLHGEVAPVS